MTPEVQTLVNPVALEIPEVREQLMHWARTEGWYTELAARMSVGGAAVIVGTTDETILEGACIVVLPGQFTEELPWVVHFHNNGPRALTHAMVNAMVAFIRHSGYTTYKALNQSGMPDKRWLRAFKLAGKPVFIGSAYFFDIRKGQLDAGNPTDRRRRRNRPKSGPVRRKQAGAETDAAKPKPRHKLSGKQSRRFDKARVSPAGNTSRRNTGRRSRRRG